MTDSAERAKVPVATSARPVQLTGCPVCGHGASAFAFASIDLLHGVPGLFVYERCTSCGSFFQNPRVVDEDLTSYYPDDYFTHGSGSGPGPAPSSGRPQAVLRRLVLEARGLRTSSAARHWCGRLLHAVGPVRRRAMYGLVGELGPPSGLDRCLELGPGTGEDMWRLSQLGWTVTGIDLDREAAEGAMLRSGSQVVVESVLDHRPDASYGLIYGSHSIEHVPNIRETIAHLRSLLGAGGRLVLILPNPMSISSRLYGLLSVVWDPPRHLSLPSPRALRSLLSEAGFSSVSVRTSPRRAAHYCAIARERRRGTTGRAAWDARITGSDRLVQAAETLLVRLGLDVGEEIVVSAAVDERSQRPLPTAVR